MKKRISILLCLSMVLLALTGCAKEKETLEYDEGTIEQVTEFLIEYCNSSTEETIEDWNSVSEYSQEYQLMQSGLPVTPESFVGAMESWQAGVEECGEYLGHGDYSYEVKGDELNVTVPVEYKERNATLLFVFDENLYLDSMTVNAEYSMSEVLEKAGLNTVLGMGTVFAVLIFISAIISLFRFIPAIENAFRRKPKTADVQEAVQAVPAETVPAEAVPETDDGELIAVIAAAIAAAEGTDADGLVVRSIRRRQSNKWNSRL